MFWFSTFQIAPFVSLVVILVTMTTFMRGNALAPLIGQHVVNLKLFKWRLGGLF